MYVIVNSITSHVLRTLNSFTKKNIKINFFSYFVICFNVQKLYKRKENKEENVLMEEKKIWAII